MAQQDPAHEIAKLFMTRKGYPSITPVDEDRDGDEWTFRYDLDGDQLELVVSWDADDGWDAYVADLWHG